MTPKPLLKPPVLEPGDQIALVAPSGRPPPAALNESIAYLQQCGYRVKTGRHLFQSYKYLAGRDEERVADLMEAFSDVRTRAIFCARGGYGCSRLLDRLDYDKIAGNPKVLLGHSDTTALHLALYARLGLVGFTGALATLDLRPGPRTSFTQGSLWRALTTTEPLGALPASSMQVLAPGRACGPLLGGCLSLVCSLLGTPFLPDFKGAILLLEDVGERPYQIDRMLNQLRLAGILSQVSGIVLGQFMDCFTGPRKACSLTLSQIVEDLARDLPIPIVAGFPYGHFKRRFVLPLGVSAILDTQVPGLQITEAALKSGDGSL